MPKLLHAGLIAVWLICFLLDLLSPLLDLPVKTTIFLPVVYLGLSFYVFQPYELGYRLAHHIFISTIIFFYLLSLLLNVREVLSGSSFASNMAANSMFSVDFTYLFFLIVWYGLSFFKPHSN